jgi:hypothetical protein
MIFLIGLGKDIIFSRYQSQRFQKWYTFEDKNSITFGIVKNISRMVDKNPLAVIYFFDVLILVR